MSKIQELGEEINSLNSPRAIEALDSLLIVSIIFGNFVMFFIIYKLSYHFNKHCCRARCQKRDRLYRKYGAGHRLKQPDLAETPHTSSQKSNGRSWAVITGGSDGIGFEMAKLLAGRDGFNIAIVARNLEKIEGKLKECRALRAGTNTLAIVADFEQLSTVEDY